MEDRQFMRLLAIVVATGLVAGLLAFGVSRRGDGGGATPAPVASASATAPTPGSTVAPGDPPADPFTDEDSTGVKPGPGPEPAPPPENAPVMRGAVNLDPPGTAATDVPTTAPAAQPDQSGAPAGQPQ